MLCALACWEHDLDKSKLDLAEESRIWPVYIDKSTPTTRTLDKYLNIETCPKNPRTQRVIDTAEFVLKQLGRRSTAERKKLQQALNDFRQLISGIKSTGRPEPASRSRHAGAPPCRFVTGPVRFRQNVPDTFRYPID